MLQLANRCQATGWWRKAALSVQCILPRLPAEWCCFGHVDVDGGMEGGSHLGGQAEDHPDRQALL